MKKKVNKKKESAVEVPYATHPHSQLTGGMRAEDSAHADPRGEEPRRPELKITMGPLNDRDSERFNRAVNWFVADVVRSVIAKKEKEHGRKKP